MQEVSYRCASTTALLRAVSTCLPPLFVLAGTPDRQLSCLVAPSFLVQSRQRPWDLFSCSAPALSSIPLRCAKREQSSTAGNCSSGVVWSTFQSGHKLGLAALKIWTWRCCGRAGRNLWGRQDPQTIKGTRGAQEGEAQPLRSRGLPEVARG